MRGSLWLLWTGLGASASFVSECDWADPDVTTCLQRSLQLDGAVAFTNVPGVARAREQALLTLTGCTAKSAPGVEEVILGDGTSRRSLGSRTVRGIPETIVGCDRMADDAAALRAIVDQATNRLLDALQPLQRGKSALLATGSRSYDTLAAAAYAGEQLEHFHAYRSGTSHAKTAAVPMHTDAGLFIAIVPALYAAEHADSNVPPTALPASPEAADGREGFQVQRWGGSVVKLSPRVESSSVVFIVGDGFTQWLNPQLTTPLRAAPHRMVMPRAADLSDGQRLARAWYGRMYLPPADSVLHAGGAPFREWREFFASHPDERNHSLIDTPADGLSQPVGCAGGRRYLSTHGAGSCLANQIFCWHQCVDVSALACGADAVCWRSTDSSIWTAEDAHCTSCEPKCFEPPSPPTVPLIPSPPPALPYTEPFCTGPGTDMHMSGFASHSTDCIILLFHGWKLDSAGAFAAGVLGTFFLGIFTEGITWFRRTKLATSPYLRSSAVVYRVSMATAFTTQVTLGYFLMLIAMTYQVELFLGVILGLGCGHTLFNVRPPPLLYPSLSLLRSHHTRLPRATQHHTAPRLASPRLASPRFVSFRFASFRLAGPECASAPCDSGARACGRGY